MPPTLEPPNTPRRDFLKVVSAGAAATALPAGLAASGSAHAQSGDIITRKIGKTGEVVPAIGLGTYLTFDLLPGAKRDHLREVFKRFYEGGGRLIDTSPLYGTGEISVGDFASAMDVTNNLFVCNKIWSTGEFLADDSHARRSMDQSMQRLWRDKIECMQVHSLVNVDQILPVMRNWKKDGLIKHVGVTHHELPYFKAMAQYVERGEVDFVQVHYSIAVRQAEERILPAALDKGIAVLVNMPFEKARLFKLVEGRSVPDFAREAGMTTWSQFFLKWVISHPAVTAAIPATANPEHQSQNMAALRGPLPDKALRERMLKHMETIPGFDKVASTPPYPGKNYPGLIRRAMAARAAAAK